jgi:CDP-glucose 4,6-dehydratase
VLEIVQAIIAISDHPEIEPIVLGKAPDGIDAQYLSSEKARRVLNWKPTYTLVEALSETLAWYKSFQNSRGLLKSGKGKLVEH